MTYTTKKANMSCINLYFTLIQTMFKVAYTNSHWIKHKMMKEKRENEIRKTKYRKSKKPVTKMRTLRLLILFQSQENV